MPGHVFPENKTELGKMLDMNLMNTFIKSRNGKHDADSKLNKGNKKIQLMNPKAQTKVAFVFFTKC